MTDQSTSFLALLTEIASRVESLGNVLNAEHRWLKPKVEEARAELEDEIKEGYADEESRCLDRLYLHSKQLDLHLRNVELGSEALLDIAATLKERIPLIEEVTE